MKTAHTSTLTVGAIVAIVLGVTVALGLWKNRAPTLPTPPTTPVALSPHTYTDPNHAFSIAYPDRASLVSSKEMIAATGYIPVCDPDMSAACIVFTSTTYPNSNFGAAGVSVNVMPPSTCGSVASATTSTQEINGVKFIHIPAGDAAAGHSSSGYDYVGMAGSTCFQVTSRVYTSTYENYPAGSIHKFTAEQEADLRVQLEKIVMTFKALAR